MLTLNYDHADIVSIDGEPISDPEQVIRDDELASKVILSGIKQAKSNAEMQEGIYGDGQGLERDPFWPMVSI